MHRTRPKELTDTLWQRIEPLIPTRPPHLKGERPANDDRQMIEAILYVLRTDIQWNACRANRRRARRRMIATDSGCSKRCLRR